MDNFEDKLEDNFDVSKHRDKRVFKMEDKLDSNFFKISEFEENLGDKLESKLED